MQRGSTDLLISNSEFALGLLVCLRELIKLADSIVIKDLLGKAHITLRVLVAWVHLGVIRQRSKNLIQRPVHLSRVALEEAATTTDEERVTREDSALGAIFKIEADAVLGVAGGVQGSYFDAVADGELGLVCRGFGNLLAVLAANDGQGELFELVL